MHLVDTHCHIDLSAFDEDRDAVLRRAREAGVEHLILIGYSPERWQSGAAIARDIPHVRLAVGLHPTQADEYTDELEHELRDVAQDVGAVAIGETGLDYHWDTASLPAQRDAFERQIALAKDLDLPFVVHQRKAAVDVLNILRQSNPPHRGVMHCFTEDIDYAEACLNMGMHLGLGGAVTFKNAKALHEVARSAPLNKLLLETDTPYMTPSPRRGERNEPAHIRYVAQRIADLRGMEMADVAEQTSRNARELFRLQQATDPAPL